MKSRKLRPDLDERFKFDQTPEEVFRRLLEDEPEKAGGPEESKDGTSPA